MIYNEFIQRWENLLFYSKLRTWFMRMVSFRESDLRNLFQKRIMNCLMLIILSLEAYGGEVSQIAALFTQLEQMGVFKQVEGIILGTFTAYEKSGATQSVFDLLAGHIPETLPVAKTTEIGHGTDSKAIVIGCNMELRN